MHMANVAGAFAEKNCSLSNKSEQSKANDGMVTDNIATKWFVRLIIRAAIVQTEYILISKSYTRIAQPEILVCADAHT